MTEASVSLAGNLTDGPEVRYTEAGIARARFRGAVSGRREQEPSLFTVVIWRDQAEHAAQSLSRVGPRVAVAVHEKVLSEISVRSHYRQLDQLGGKGTGFTVLDDGKPVEL
jgi:hypothetical protein